MVKVLYPNRAERCPDGCQPTEISTTSRIKIDRRRSATVSHGGPRPRQQPAQVGDGRQHRGRDAEHDHDHEQRRRDALDARRLAVLRPARVPRHARIMARSRRRPPAGLSHGLRRLSACSDPSPSSTAIPAGHRAVRSTVGIADRSAARAFTRVARPGRLQVPAGRRQRRPGAAGGRQRRLRAAPDAEGPRRLRPARAAPGRRRLPARQPSRRRRAAARRAAALPAGRARHDRPGRRRVRPRRRRGPEGGDAGARGARRAAARRRARGRGHGRRDRRATRCTRSRRSATRRRRSTSSARAPRSGAAHAALLEKLPRFGGAEFDEDVAEVLRVEAGIPRFGAELDEQVMPAEVGVVDRAVSFTKGCYVGQEPVARLHYRGHANRSLRALAPAVVPGPGAVVVSGEREVGRVTSAVESPVARRPAGARRGAPRGGRRGARAHRLGGRRVRRGGARRAALRLAPLAVSLRRARRRDARRRGGRGARPDRRRPRRSRRTGPASAAARRPASSPPRSNLRPAVVPKVRKGVGRAARRRRGGLAADPRRRAAGAGRDQRRLAVRARPRHRRGPLAAHARAPSRTTPATAWCARAAATSASTASRRRPCSTRVTRQVYVADALGRVFAIVPVTGDDVPTWPRQVLPANRPWEHPWGALALAPGRLYLTTGRPLPRRRQHVADLRHRPRRPARCAPSIPRPAVSTGPGSWGGGGVAVDPATGEVWAATGPGAAADAPFGGRVVRLSPDLGAARPHGPRTGARPRLRVVARAVPAGRLPARS